MGHLFIQCLSAKTESRGRPQCLPADGTEVSWEKDGMCFWPICIQFSKKLMTNWETKENYRQEECTFFYISCYVGVNQQKLDKVLRTNFFCIYIPTERHSWSLSVGSDSKAASIKTCLSKLSRHIQGLCYKELLCFSSFFIVLRRAMNHSASNFVKLQGEKKH